MQAIVTATQMAAADRFTIDQLGVPGITLMEHAARACAQELGTLLGEQDQVLVLVGPGNNGGDGLAIARLLHERGVTVRVRCISDPGAFQGDSAVNYQRLTAAGVPCEAPNGPLATEIDETVTWLVDSLFGTGLSRPISGDLATLVNNANAAPAKILAVDVPSGLNGNHGRVDGVVVKADVTVTFQRLKTAHVVTPACTFCGQIRLHDIGIQFSADAGVNRFLMEASDYDRPPRQQDSHKGRFGTLAVLGGFRGMQGAAFLAGRAALRFGAGKVRLFSDAPEGFGQPGSLMVGDAGAGPGTQHYDALVVGPGLSRNATAQQALEAWNLHEQRVVWDADSLAFVAQFRESMGTEWVMTPHPGEAAALLGVTAAQVQADRTAAIAALANYYPGGWIVLKGYRTLIQSPDGELFICGTGNAALATAGSGDVLSGMIGAMLAGGAAIGDAVLSAVLRHGLAADRWVQQYRDYSMTAEDIIEDLRF